MEVYEQSLTLKPTLKFFNDDFDAKEIYPELPDRQSLPNELEAFMWLSILHRYNNWDKSDTHFMYDKTPDFIKIKTGKEFEEYLPISFGDGSDTPVKRNVYVNQKFDQLYSREALTASVFVMDNKTMLHVRNTYKYLDYLEILMRGRLTGDRFSNVSFNLLTDTYDTVPVMSLYTEAVAGIFIDRTDPANTVQVVMDKYTGIAIFHRLYSLCQEQLPSFPYRPEDVPHDDKGDPNSPFVKEFQRICGIFKGIDGIDALRREIMLDRCEREETD